MRLAPWLALVLACTSVPALSFELPHRIEVGEIGCETGAISWGGVSAAYEHPGQTTGSATFNLANCEDTIAGAYLNVDGIKGFKDGLGKNIDLAAKGFEWEHSCSATSCTIWITNTRRQTKAARWTFSVLFE